MSDELENSETQPVTDAADEQLTLGEQDAAEDAAVVEESQEPTAAPEDVEPEAAPEETPEPEGEADLEPEPEPDEAAEPDEPVEAEVAEAEPAEPEESTESTGAPEEAPSSVSWVPFSLYLGLWVVLAVATVVLLRTPAAAGGALWAPEYALSVYGGVALVALGPILALVVWLVARAKAEPEHRTGLLTSALLRSAGATFVGVILWLVALYMLDLYRAGFHV